MVSNQHVHLLINKVLWDTGHGENQRASLSEHGSRLCVRAVDIEVNLTLLTFRKGRKCIHPAFDLHHHVSSTCGNWPRITTGRWSAGDDMNRVSTTPQNFFRVAPQEHWYY